MAVSNVKAFFPCDIQTIWNTVTSLEHYSWRSDLSKIEVLSQNIFVEYTKDGYATTFTTTLQEPFRRWEFDMENDLMRGHWTGIFVQENDGTTLDFTEDVTAKKLLMKPFVKAYLRKQQAAYIRDLKNALEAGR